MSLTGCVRSMVNRVADRNPKNWTTVYSNGSAVVEKNKISGNCVSYVTHPEFGRTAKIPGDCFTNRGK